LLAGRPLWIKRVMSNYSFTEEPFSKEVYDEMYPLLEEHWAEIATDKSIELAPDFDNYQLLQDTDHLHMLFCRDEINQIIGYMVTFITPHMHYKNMIYAQNDLIYIHPNHRRGSLASRMLKVFEQQMKEKGVDVIHMHVKVAFEFGAMLTRIGFMHEENIYRKKIGD
jgi:GNAT superfamily N-acetyltransferase